MGLHQEMLIIQIIDSIHPTKIWELCQIVVGFVLTHATYET